MPCNLVCYCHKLRVAFTCTNNYATSSKSDRKCHYLLSLLSSYLKDICNRRYILTWCCNEALYFILSYLLCKPVILRKLVKVSIPGYYVSSFQFHWKKIF